MLENLFGSKSRYEILRILFDGNHTSIYLRELSRESGVQPSALLKECKNLLTIELIESRKDGNRLYYQANRDHPLYLDLVSIVEKTSGMEFILRKALKDQRIELALLFGSMASHEERAQSDVDLIVVGKMGLRVLSELLAVSQQKISRPINPIVYSAEEFSHKLRAKNHFLSRVLKKKWVVLVGDPSAYPALKKGTSRS